MSAKKTNHKSVGPGMSMVGGIIFKNGVQFGESRQVHELSTVNSKKLFHTFESALSPKEDLFPTELFYD